MIDLLRQHRDTLNNLLAEASEINPEGKGAQITMNIYRTILEDGVEILGSLIVFLSRD